MSGENSKMPKSRYRCGEKNTCCFQKKQKTPKIKGNSYFLFPLSFFFFVFFSCLNSQGVTLNKPAANQGSSKSASWRNEL